MITLRRYNYVYKWYILTLKQTNNENGNVTTTRAQAHPVKNVPHTPGSTGALSSAERNKKSKALLISLPVRNIMYTNKLFIQHVYILCLRSLPIFKQLLYLYCPFKEKFRKKNIDLVIRNIYFVEGLVISC